MVHNGTTNFYDFSKRANRRLVRYLGVVKICLFKLLDLYLFNARKISETCSEVSSSSKQSWFHLGRRIELIYIIFLGSFYKSDDIRQLSSEWVNKRSCLLSFSCCSAVPTKFRSNYLRRRASTEFTKRFRSGRDAFFLANSSSGASLTILLTKNVRFLKAFFRLAWIWILLKRVLTVPWLPERKKDEARTTDSLLLI